MAKVLVGDKYTSKLGIEAWVISIRATKGKRNIMISYPDPILDKVVTDLVSQLELEKRFLYYSGNRHLAQ